MEPPFAASDNESRDKRKMRKVLVIPDDNNGTKALAVDEADYHVVHEILLRSNPRDRIRIGNAIKTRDDDGDHRVWYLGINFYDEHSQPHLNAIWKLSYLTTLYLRGPFVTSIPPCVGQLKNLRELNLISAFLRELPTQIGDLASLETLDLSFAQIASLPASIGKLKNLTHLNLFHTTALAELPNEIGELSVLKVLTLSWSKIASLPSSIGKLLNLKNLHLAGVKKLTQLPEDIGNLSNLEWLDLRISGIKLLPSSFGRLTSLMCLHMQQNPMIHKLEKENDLDHFLLALVQQHPLLGALGSLECGRPKLLHHMLACNRVQFRLGLGTPKDVTAHEMMPKLWPNVLQNATRVFGTEEKFYGWPAKHNIEKSDAIYQLLVDGLMESLVVTLMDRDLCERRGN